MEISQQSNKKRRWATKYMNRRFTEEIHTQVVNKYIHDRMFSKSVAIRENENQNEILIHIYQNGSFSFSNILYIYSRETQKERQRHRQREEKQAPCKKPDVGLNPGNPGSGPVQR